MRYVYLAKTIIKNRNNEYLVLQRSSTDLQAPGRVDLPGGGIEADENARNAAVREAMEESGLEVDNETLQLRFSFTRMNEDHITVRHLFYVEVEHYEVVLSHEHDAFWWVGKNEFIQSMEQTAWGEGIHFLERNSLL